MPQPPETVSVGRSDAVYMAHAYLTKVPVGAIEPFILAHTEPGDVVLDLFAGSGMTGVAAAMTGRRSVLMDISALGQHIGNSYLNVVSASMLTEAVAEACTKARERIGDVYAAKCSRCGDRATLAKAIYSVVSACLTCDREFVYYEALAAAKWKKKEMACPGCGAAFTLRSSPRLAEQRIRDIVQCACWRHQIEQEPTDPLEQPNLAGLTWPQVEITADRQMYQASALGKHGLTTTDRFFTTRNLAALAALRDAINEVSDEAIRGKALFAFTAILARASKRYQWHHKRPLNAANQTYYIAPVFYEWNVYDLFLRKAQAVISSDTLVVQTRRRRDITTPIQNIYLRQSSHTLPLANHAVDYVFTDPPFGSNIFYSDMNLFQEAWLGTQTDHQHEAVVDRAGHRDIGRYENLLTQTLRECHRVLKRDGRLSLVFSNSSGAMWALVQRVITTAGFELDDAGLALLDKGQRSVKGLASGSEAVVTMDMILTLRKRSQPPVDLYEPGTNEIIDVVRRAVSLDTSRSPTHVYLTTLHHGIRQGWSLANVDFRLVWEIIEQAGHEVDSATGHIKGRGTDTPLGPVSPQPSRAKPPPASCSDHEPC